MLAGWQNTVRILNAYREKSTESPEHSEQPFYVFEKDFEAVYKISENSPGQPLRICTEELENANCAIAYADGSYSQQTQKYAYGVVLFENDKKYILYGGGDSPRYLPYANMTGEMLAFRNIFQWTLLNQCKKIKIYYDYEPIEHYLYSDHLQTDVKIGKDLRELYDSLKYNVAFDFQYIRGHQGNALHDEADMLSKYARVRAEIENLSDFTVTKMVDPEKSCVRYSDDGKLVLQ